MVPLPKFRIVSATSQEVANSGACSHERRASICRGLGSRSKSRTKATTTRRSHRNIAAISLGIHQAGTSQRKPKRRATKKRGPRPKGTRPRGRARAATPGGTRGRGGFIRELSFSEPSLWHFHRRNYLSDHLIGGQTLEVGFGLEEQAMAENGESSGFHVV